MKRIFAKMMMIASCGAVAVASPVLKDVEFVITNDVGLGNEVCVTGPHALLGGNDPLKAPKLAWNPDNIWRGTIALPAGETIAYRFISRNYSTASWGSATNSSNISTVLSVGVPAHVPAPWTNKTVFLHSPWTNANIFWRNLTAGETNWTTTAMTALGAGRNANEFLFRGAINAGPGAEIEFVFNNGATNWSNAPAPPSGTPTGAAPAVPTPYQGLIGPYNFRTTLDQFFVQDGSVFNYRPPATVAAPQIITTNVGSTVTNIPARPVTICLPRGYAQNTWKKYPVVYFHDGQNIFFPGGPFGTWDADRIAGYEVSQGRMREAILVAIPNGNAYGSDRLYEYLPDGDTIANYANLGLNFSGRASLYLQWMLDNLAPTLDFNFRTFGSNPNDTLTAGSSMGGLVSDYIGFMRPDRFGAVGIFSPAYWAGPNYLANRVLTNQPVRRYISMGTAESSGGQSSSNIYWQDALTTYNRYLRVGETVNRDILFTGVAGGSHSESAWSRLLPQFFGWALNPWREANHLALEIAPPKLQIAAREDGTLDLRREELRGFAQSLAASSDLSSWTTNPVIATGEAWDAATSNVVPTGRQFWQLRTVAP
jgi:predicted alpha/beta superfamily hydrolase